MNPDKYNSRSSWLTKSYSLRGRCAESPQETYVGCRFLD